MSEAKGTRRALQVLLLSRNASYQRFGGPVMVIRHILKEQARRPIMGVELAAVLPDGVFPSDSVLSPSWGLDLRGKPLISSSLSFVEQAALSAPKLLWHLNASARSIHGPLVLHCHDFVSAYLCRRRFGRRYRILFTIHARGGGVREVLLDYPVLGKTPIAWLARHIETSAVRWADALIFPSRGARELFAGEHRGLLEGKDVRVVYNGLDVEEVRALSDEGDVFRRHGLVEGEPLVLSIGALVRDKGADTLVKALAALPDALRVRTRCLIVGDWGHLRNELESLIKEKQLTRQVSMTGILPHQHVVQLMRRATLLAMPTRVAVFDVVLLEAGALGLPVVTSNVGAHVEMFDRETALLVPPDDPAALTAAILRILTDDSLKKQLAMNASRRVRNQFSAEAMLHSYGALYQEFGGMDQLAAAKEA